MTGIDWTAEFCLGCDIQTDGAAYCSEACRLQEFEKTSESCSVLSSANTTPTPSVPSSPSIHASPAYPWTLQQPAALSMSTFTNTLKACPASSSLDSHQRTISTSSSSSILSSHPEYAYASTSDSGRKPFSTSSSHSSLYSIQTAASTESPSRLAHNVQDSVAISDRAYKELREYAMTLEYVKLQKRRSY